MHTRHLIDALVQQTTILIAQLATAAGIRAPLAHVADQVFLHLSREIESQGVRRKVAADMFGLALRSYQKKVRRLLESESAPDRTLWEAVATFVAERGEVSRPEVLDAFRRDDPMTVAAILNDLARSGLVEAKGRGDDARFRSVDVARLPADTAEPGRDLVASRLWMSVDDAPAPREEVVARFDFDPVTTRRALDALLAEGRLQVDAEGRLRSGRFVVPVGAEAGWEAAVFDHFRALAKAVAAKVRSPRSRADDRIGGATLSFDLHPDHPHREEVETLLARVREDVNALWERVAEYNRAHPFEGEGRRKVFFYFGQNVEDAGTEEPK